MAMGKPIVAYSLDETRWTADGAAIYVELGNVREFGRAIVMLADQPDQRMKMGKIGRERILKSLSWEHQEISLLRAYEKVLSWKLE